jgi:hypothetical protein
MGQEERLLTLSLGPLCTRSRTPQTRAGRPIALERAGLSLWGVIIVLLVIAAVITVVPIGVIWFVMSRLLRKKWRGPFVCAAPSRDFQV